MKISSIEELKDRAEAYAADCADAKAHTGRIEYVAAENGLGHVNFQVKDQLFGQTAGSADLNQHAFSQLVERLDAPPVRWISDDGRCSPQLRDTIFNTLLDERELVERMAGDLLYARG